MIDSKKEKQIINLLKRGFFVYSIEKKLKVSKPPIQRLAKEHNLKLKYHSKGGHMRKPGRNLEIKKMLLDGKKYEDIAFFYGISRERVKQIAHKFGIIRWEESRKRNAKWIEEIQLIKSDLKKGMSLKNLREKYKLNSFKLYFLYDNGLPNLNLFFNRKRNEKILDLYINKKLTAREIVENKEENIGLKSKNSVYLIVSDKFGIHKQSKIKNRHIRGTINEDKRVLKKIVSLRDNKKLSFKDIAEILNNKCLTTVSGKIFSEAMVGIKYHQAKKIKNENIRTNNL